MPHYPRPGEVILCASGRDEETHRTEFPRNRVFTMDRYQELEGLRAMPLARAFVTPEAAASIDRRTVSVFRNTAAKSCADDNLYLLTH